ncbi:MAG: CapA family protein [Chloroflexi bacterium]|nr:CapA family protein [Chloroflexota bacterium]MBP8054563.1 CapA family protein [Chloroflexota bacterium]
MMTLLKQLLWGGYWGAALLLLLAGCGIKRSIAAANPSPSPITITLAPTTTFTPLPPTVTLAPIATFTPIPTATATATATATPTPVPLVQIALPATWANLEPLILADNTTNTAWQWAVTFTEAPETIAAPLTLVPGETTLPVGTIPLALVVPFTHRWEDVDGVMAQYILANGHELAVVRPWREITPQFKALRVDGLRPPDEGYPLQQPWGISAMAGYEAAGEALAALLRPHFPADTVVHLGAVGDLMLSRTLGNYIAAGDLAYPFQYLPEYLTSPDYTIGNLETSLGDIGEPAPKAYPFQSPLGSAEALALGGFDLVSLANNHAMDYGPEALLQGLDLLAQAGVAVVGAGVNDAAAHTPYITEVNGLKLAFLGYVHVPREASSGFDVETWNATTAAPGLAWGYPERIRADVAAAVPLADHVIVILHSGFEYIEEPSEPQIAAAHAAIEAGATLVIGHHAHILQGIEYYQNGVIVYGLANFAFNIDGPPETAIANIWLDAAGVRQIEIIPAMVKETGQPRPALPHEATPILERVYFLTTILNPVKPTTQ